MNQVCVVGLWHLGLVSAVGFCDLGWKVTGLDFDEKLITNLRRGEPPLYEPGLTELIQSHQKASRLRFEVDPQAALDGIQTVLITYDTPVDDKDRVDLSPIESALRLILPHLASNALLIINSQVPVGSTEKWQRMISEARPDNAIDVVYSPENIRLGQALSLFKQPDMLVIGSNSERACGKAKQFYASFQTEKFFVSWRTAEMAKHALNTFFATTISLANELGNLCDAVAADGVEIARILKQDSRIGKRAQVRPGLGFAGATLARDLRGLQAIGASFGIPTPLVNSVLEINQRQILQVARMVELYFEGALKNKTLTVFGLTYKPGTSTLRRSASLEIIRELHLKGAKIKAHDPGADLSEFHGEKTFEFSRDPYEASEASYGILILTEWPAYRELDYRRIKKQMAHPMILDAKNYLESTTLKQMGFTYLEIGRGQLARGKASCV